MGQTETALAHADLASRQLARAEHGPALESLATALRLAPGLDTLWSQFAELIRYFNLRHPVPAFVRELLAKALEHPAVDPGDLVRPITTLALSRSGVDAFGEPLLLRLLEDVVIRDGTLERQIVETRRALLERVFDPAPQPLALQTAIAHQCFNTEYVFEETADERERIARLRGAITAAAQVPPHWCAVYASYRSLLTLGNSDLAASSLVRRQVTEPLEEQRWHAEIPALAATDNSVSAAVQAQYEASPYPRWVRTQLSAAPGTLVEILRELFPLADLKGIVETPPRILVAGCGTGQHASTTARRFVGASVVALDLSLASLAYAKRKSRELGMHNIEYCQADILGLRNWDERFDLIECSGVLHHMEDPLEGWRILAQLLKPGGVMRLGLYSETGRQPVVRARELIAAEGFLPTPDGIRACRGAIRARTGDAMLAKIARSEDFYSMSGCRDLLFHVQEHRFTVPQIATMIARVGMRFLGFEFTDAGATLGRYQARYSQVSDLKNWHDFEQEFPDTFARMYQFWVGGGN